MFSDIATAMETMMENAITFCTEKTGLQGMEQILEARKQADCLVCEYLRYGLAKEVAEYLGSLDNKVKAVYVYDDLEDSISWNGRFPDRPSLSPGIRMIVWVSGKSPALSTVLESLSSAVEKESSQLACPRANALCHQLDVTVVDDHEVQKRIGSGALLSSLYLHPMEIWRR